MKEFIYEKRFDTDQLCYPDIHLDFYENKLKNMCISKDEKDSYITLNSIYTSKTLMTNKKIMDFYANSSSNTLKFSSVDDNTNEWKTNISLFESVPSTDQSKNFGNYLMKLSDSTSVYLPIEESLILDNPNEIYINFIEFNNRKWKMIMSFVDDGLIILNVFQISGEPIKFSIEYQLNAYQIDNHSGTKYGSYQFTNHFSNGYVNRRIKLDNDDYYNIHIKSLKCTKYNRKYLTTCLPFIIDSDSNQDSYSLKSTSNTYMHSIRSTYSNYNVYYYTKNYVPNNKQLIQTQMSYHGVTIYQAIGLEDNTELNTTEKKLIDFLEKDFKCGYFYHNYSSPEIYKFDLGIPYEGYFTTDNIEFKDIDIYENSFIELDYDKPEGTEIELQFNMSSDGGKNWYGFVSAKEDNSIPILLKGQNIENLLFKFRVLMRTWDNKILPKLYGLKVKVQTPAFKYIVSNKNDIMKFHEKYYWEEFPYNYTGYMESNDFPEPYKCEASSIYSKVYDAWKAFNHTNLTAYDCWASGNGKVTGHLIYDFSERNHVRPFKYEIVSRNDGNQGVSPKAWKISASNDKLDWVLLDERVDITGWSKDETKEFFIDHTFLQEESYRYVKLDITENNGHSSIVAVGQFKIFTNLYSGYDGEWEKVGEKPLTKEIFDLYGYDTIQEINNEKLLLLEEPYINVNISNQNYIPSAKVRGFVKSPIRYQVREKENNKILKAWSKFYIDDTKDSFTVDYRAFNNSSKPKTFTISSENRNGYAVERDMNVILINQPPVIHSTLVNNLLTVRFNDEKTDVVKFKITINGKNMISDISEDGFTNWYKVPSDIKFIVNSKDILINKENIIEITVQDKFFSENKVKHTFIGQYSGILFKDESGKYFSNDLGEILQYLRFELIKSGDITLERKIMFENKNGYSIKNINILTESPYEKAFLELSFTNNPFKPSNRLVYGRTFKPNDYGLLYIRLNTVEDRDNIQGIIKVTAKAEAVIE